MESADRPGGRLRRTKQSLGEQMTDTVWTKRTNRRTFLRGMGVAAVGVGLGASGLAAACGGSSTGSGSTPTALASIKPEPDGDLNYFNWSDYMNPDIFKGFEQEYGVKVHQTYFDNMSGMMAKIRAGVDYDVTFPEAPEAYQLREGGYLLAYDHSALKSWGQVIPFFQDPWYDPHSLHTVPYVLWTTGIGWNSDEVGDLSGSWNDLWDHPEAKGRINLLNDMHETLGMSLIRLGYDFNTTDPGQLSKAADALLQLKPELRAITTDDIPAIQSGQVWIHHCWSGDFWVAMSGMKEAERKPWRYETCKEGIPVGNDTMVILKNAPHPGTALLFIDWVLGHAAENTGWVGFPMPETDGLSAFEKVVAEYPTLNVTTDMLQHGEPFKYLGQEGTQLWTQEWSKFKA